MNTLHQRPLPPTGIDLTNRRKTIDYTKDQIPTPKMEIVKSATTTIESMPSMSQASSSSHTASPYPVRVLDKSEYKQAALSLAQAFKDDEVVMYPIKTADRKNSTPEKDWKLHLHMMECIVYAHCISGQATVIGPNYDCVALWMDPGANMDNFCTMFRSGMWSFHWKLSKEGRKRFFGEFLPLLHNTKHEVLGKEETKSWYLVYIGTRPESRGRGYAKALIEDITQKCDSENRLTYLESSNPLNLKLYGRLGFKFAKKIHLTRGQKLVEMDIMTRVPVMRQLATKTFEFAEEQQSQQMNGN